MPNHIIQTKNEFKEAVLSIDTKNKTVDQVLAEVMNLDLELPVGISLAEKRAAKKYDRMGIKSPWEKTA